MEDHQPQPPAPQHSCATVHCRSSFRRSYSSRRTRAAVVTLVKNAADVLSDWVAYHLAIGIVHCFVFFDEPEELDDSLYKHHPRGRLTLVACDAKLRADWLSAHGSELVSLAFEQANRIGHGLNVRQELCAAHALASARERGDIDWLLHLDSDELFYPGSHGDAAAHFATLDAIGADTFAYVNHEAVCESRTGTARPFRDLTLFKRNVDALPRTDAVREAGRFWTDRCGPSGYFSYYDNGKGAARVAANVWPTSPHEWAPGRAEMMSGTVGGQQRCRSCTNMTSRMELRHIGEHNLPLAWELQGALCHVPCDACVLHYPVWRWEVLWDRWRRGNFPPSLQTLHHTIHAQQLSSLGHGASGDPAQQRAVEQTIQRIFEEFLALDDATETSRQLEAGVCERFLAPRHILEGTATRREAPLRPCTATQLRAPDADVALTRSRRLPPSDPAVASLEPPARVAGVLALASDCSRSVADGALAAARELAERGYVLCSGGCGSSVGGAAIAEIDALIKAGKGRAARILEGRDSCGARRGRSRVPASSSPAESVLGQLDAALAAFARELVDALAGLAPADAGDAGEEKRSFGRAEDGTAFVVSARTELQLQCLAAGDGSYAPHVDNADGDGREHDFGRVLTLLYYVNDAWDSERDGGQLRLYLPKRESGSGPGRHCPDGPVEVLDVAPQSDTLVVLRADRILHEVRPTRRRRLALQIWVYCDSHASASRPEVHDRALQVGGGADGVRAAKLYPGPAYARAIQRALTEHTALQVTQGKGRSARGRLWVSGFASSRENADDSNIDDR